MSPKLWPPPPTHLTGQKKSSFFSCFINILLEPVLGPRGDNTQHCFNEKRFSRACWIFLVFCLKKRKGGGHQYVTYPLKVVLMFGSSNKHLIHLIINIIQCSIRKIVTNCPLISPHCHYHCPYQGNSRHAKLGIKYLFYVK